MNKNIMGKPTCHNSRATKAEQLLARNVKFAQKALNDFLAARDEHNAAKRKFDAVLNSTLSGATLTEEEKLQEISDRMEARSEQPPSAPYDPSASLYEQATKVVASDAAETVQKMLAALQPDLDPLPLTEEDLTTVLQPAATAEAPGAPVPLPVPDLRRYMASNKDTEVWASGDCTGGFIGDEDPTHAPKGTLVCGYGDDQADISDAHADWLSHAQLCHAEGRTGSVKLVQRAHNGSQQIIAQWPARIAN